MPQNQNNYIEDFKNVLKIIIKPFKNELTPEVVS